MTHTRRTRARPARPRSVDPCVGVRARLRAPTTWRTTALTIWTARDRGESARMSTRTRIPNVERTLLPGSKMHVKRRDVGWLVGFASRSRGFDEVCPGTVDDASSEPARLFGSDVMIAEQRRAAEALSHHETTTVDIYISMPSHLPIKRIFCTHVRPLQATSARLASPFEVRLRSTFGWVLPLSPLMRFHFFPSSPHPGDRVA